MTLIYGTGDGVATLHCHCDTADQRAHVPPRSSKNPGEQAYPETCWRF